MTAYPPLAVANAVLNEAWTQGRNLTIMQLLKLVYIAHGWSLALLDTPLVSRQPQAWQHGPVFPEIYRTFRRFGSGPILEKGQTGFGQVAEATLSPAQQQIVKSVVSGYAHMHAFTLSNITHQPGTPWSRTYNNGLGSSHEIPNEIIAEHYRQLAQERGAAPA